MAACFHFWSLTTPPDLEFTIRYHWWPSFLSNFDTLRRAYSQVFTCPLISNHYHTNSTITRIRKIWLFDKIISNKHHNLFDQRNISWYIIGNPLCMLHHIHDSMSISQRAVSWWWADVSIWRLIINKWITPRPLSENYRPPDSKYVLKLN